MGSINRLFTESLAVSRMVWTTDESDNEYSALTEVGTITAHIQQSSMELSEHLKLAFGKVFTIWCAPNANVKAGDMLSDGTYTYRVAQTHLHDWGSNAHMELYCEREPYDV